MLLKLAVEEYKGFALMVCLNPMGVRLGFVGVPNSYASCKRLSMMLKSFQYRLTYDEKTPLCKFRGKEDFYRWLGFDFITGRKPDLDALKSILKSIPKEDVRFIQELEELGEYPPLSQEEVLSILKSAVDMIEQKCKKRGEDEG